MKHSNYRKLTVLAATIGLACGSFAIADEDLPDEPSGYPETSATQQQSGDDTARQGMQDQTLHDVQQSREQSSASNADIESAKLFGEDITSEYKLSKFAAAVEKAGLSKALANGTEYTVFAPNDDAFDTYSDDFDDASVEEIRALVRSHIVAGTVNAERARSLDSAMVLTGESVPISTHEDKLEIGDAEIVSADIRSGNLTIHVIDGVLEPTTVAARVDQIEDPEEGE